MDDNEFQRFPDYGEENENFENDHIVTFNLGGSVMQILMSTILYSPIVVPAFADSEFMERHWDDERQQYFFDRDPRAFRIILNYIRTGTIHLPTNMCSPIVTAEFKFWGLNAKKIESCCWKEYSHNIMNLNKLRKLEHDRRPLYMYPEDRFKSMYIPETLCARIKMFVYSIVSIEKSSNWKARIYSCLSFGFVILSVIIISMETVEYNQEMHDSVLWFTGKSDVSPPPALEEYRPSYKNLWEVLDQVIVVFFSLELVVTLLSCPSKRKLLKDKLFVLDIIVIVPDYVTEILRYSVTEFNEEKHYYITDVMRSVRLLRIVRLLRRIPGLYIILFTLQTSIRELVVILGILLCATFFFSSLIYYAGNQSLGEGDNIFDSIPVGCWWAVTTLATVGYGDMFPTELPGYFIGGACATVGAVLLGLTIPTLIKNFLSMYFNIKYMMYKEAEYLRRTVRMYNRRNATTKQRVSNFTLSLGSRTNLQEISEISVSNTESQALSGEIRETDSVPSQDVSSKKDSISSAHNP